MTKQTKEIVESVNDLISDGVKIKNSETRKFKMHPDLLFSVIQSQAGTIEKALLEGTMNTVDAGATECVISIDNNGYSISDDGKGFVSKEEVDEFFETFGTPHKEGDAVYGRFRMGRGQLFAFSSTVWRTSTFQMSVDVKKDGLDYQFSENLPFENGCKIKGVWYERLKDAELFNVIKEFEKLVKYMQIPVILNGTNISLKAEEQKWDYKEEDFFIKTNKNQNVLSVYNMGALVAHYPASKFGVGGTVVTKKALKVNFARNDVLVSQCSLWKRINKKLQEVMGIETAKKTVLTDYERTALIEAVLNKSMFIGEVMNKGLVLDVSDKKLTFANLMKKDEISFSKEDRSVKRAEEKVNDLKLCCVLDHSVLDTFQCKDGNEFIKKINDLIVFNNNEADKKIHELISKYGRGWKTASREDYKKYSEMKIHGNFSPKLKDIKELTDTMKGSSNITDTKDLTKKEKSFLNALKVMNECIVRALNHHEYKKSGYKHKLYGTVPERKIILGESDVAAGWTDGNSYVAINKNLNGKSASYIASVMVHEYCHNNKTLEAHDHDVNFFELFHEVMLHEAERIEMAVLAYQKNYNKELIAAGIKPRRDYDLNVEVKTTFEDVKEQEKAQKNEQKVEIVVPEETAHVKKKPGRPKLKG